METLKKLDGIENLSADNEMKREYLKTTEDIAETSKAAAATISRGVTKIKLFVHDNPGITIGIAVGVGALVTFGLMKAWERKGSSNDHLLSDLLAKGKDAWSHFREEADTSDENVNAKAGV